METSTAIRPVAGSPRWMREAAGWLAFLSALMLLALAVPAARFDPGSGQFLLFIGAIGIWRYSLGILHFLRGMLFLYWVFPRLRRKARALGDAAMPSRVYLMITSFRIEAETTAAVYRAAFREAAASGLPTTVVASLVELGDEQLVRSLWGRMQMPDNCHLKIVRIPGTGKRDGLAQGFRAISRDLPPEDAVVAVIDGDTVIDAGIVRATAPYFALLPKVGGLTTDEFCEVRGSYVMSQWHKLRFAQRHINMCSMALSRRVLTMTGRMSLFRASVVTRPEFIHDVQHDELNHWRLGRFRFLTGDDKSSWFSLMRQGWDTFYVPDAAIRTVEHPPDKSFWVASRKLMFRWYGNSLRQNSRATQLGPGRLGWFTYYVLWDQRVSMWTCLLGLSVALVASLKFGEGVLLAYLLWIGLSRLFLTLLLPFSGHRIGPAFPLILYYNQIVGSLMKINVFFRLDQQSWTRQDTALQRDLSPYQRWFNRWSSRVMTFSAASLFAAIVITLGLGH